MSNFGSCFVTFLESLVDLEYFQYLVIAMALFGVVFLIKKIIFD